MSGIGRRSLGFWLLAALVGAFVLFLYGPMLAIVVLSFQGPEGGLTFPLRGVSLHWFRQLWEGIGTVDIGGAFRRSLLLGSVVMGLTVLLSLGAGLAYRKRLPAAELAAIRCSGDATLLATLLRARSVVV